MKKFKCPCGYIYDPEIGEKQTHTPPGTSFEDLPDDWLCPRCGYEKEYFREVKQP
jgi:rubredoxin